MSHGPMDFFDLRLVETTVALRLIAKHINVTLQASTEMYLEIF